jgi:hypothetical protein
MEITGHYCLKTRNSGRWDLAKYNSFEAMETDLRGRAEVGTSAFEHLDLRSGFPF